MISEIYLKSTVKLLFGLWVALMLQLAFAVPTLVAKGKTLHIAIVKWRGDSVAERGFKDALQALSCAATYMEWNAEHDKKELGRLMRQELQPKLDQFDYVYSFGTTASQATNVIVNQRAPQLFNIVAAPVGAGLLRTLAQPGSNINGATNKIPLADQILAARQVFHFKRLGLLFNPREKNSMIERQRLRAVAKKFHFQVVDLRSPPAMSMT